MLKILITINSEDKKANAKGLYDIDNGKVLIYKGSTIKEVTIGSDYLKSYETLRNELINSGKIKDLTLQEDIEFNNPNTAAGIVLGRNASGNERIKIEERGKPLSHIIKQLETVKDKTKIRSNISVKKTEYGGTRKYDAKRFCDESYNYLLSIKPEIITDKDLEFTWKGSFNKYKSLKDILERMLISTQNYQSRPNIIKYRLDGGRKEKIDKLLFGLDAKKILENYDSDTICETFQKEFGINPGRVWKSRCKSIISSCKFLSEFKSVEDFKNFIESYDNDIDSRIKLIKYIQHNIHGFGFALSCDFIKEIGYTNFCKPDVHIKDILLGLGICNTKDDEIIFRCLCNLAEEGGYTPYKLDKVLWIICSGKFFSSKIEIKAEIPRHKDAFIEYMKNL